MISIIIFDKKNKKIYNFTVFTNDDEPFWIITKILKQDV